MMIFDSSSDFTTTLKKALSDITKRWKDLPGLIVPGSHHPTDIEEKIEAIRNARITGMPALLICLGYQIGAIEYARNVLGIADATSEEFGEGTFVVQKRKDGLKVGEHNGETYWSNYEVIPEIEEQWEKPKNFFLTPSHPEYQSSKAQPHPLLVSFLAYSRFHA